VKIVLSHWELKFSKAHHRYQLSPYVSDPNFPVPPDLQSGGLEYQESKISEANFNPLLPFVQILVLCRITDPYTLLRRRIADPPQ